MIRFTNLLEAPTASICQLVKVITFVLYLFGMVEMNKNEKKMKRFTTTTFFTLPFVTLIDPITKTVIFYLIFIDI